MSKAPMTLHLTLKRHWFDMIAIGLKRTEFRECKPYWEKRLSKFIDAIRSGEECFVELKNGYRKDSPKMTFEIGSILVENPLSPNTFLGEPDCKHFSILLKRKATEK